MNVKEMCTELQAKGMPKELLFLATIKTVKEGHVAGLSNAELATALGFTEKFIEMAVLDIENGIIETMETALFGEPLPELPGSLSEIKAGS